MSFNSKYNVSEIEKQKTVTSTKLNKSSMFAGGST
jgi:hypothetical protein